MSSSVQAKQVEMKYIVLVNKFKLDFACWCEMLQLSALVSLGAGGKKSLVISALNYCFHVLPGIKSIVISAVNYCLHVHQRTAHTSASSTPLLLLKPAAQAQAINTKLFTNKHTSNNGLLEKDGGTKNCTYKD